MQSVGVFCSSHKDIDKTFVDAARQLGTWLASERKTLVYGGTRLGLMEVVAQAVKSGGGTVYGVVPTVVVERRLVSDCIDVEFRCESLSDRKEIMLRESEVFVALPGGIGTLDEIFTVLAANTIGYHRKLTVLYNVEGFWNPTISMLEQMQSGGIVGSDIHERLKVANTFDELTLLLS